ncbi:hypothetical protein CYLTODRAFT_149456 [Cylindrobasidium torrendii FP15055 ss-10]|uniref:Uncharacterized protein n=1 Tax=Cylindrobasidium torrendii FP15055 ss-10 TaxID=1314674 RepID=A0A0D7AXY4_9AGAR|nr:hypothetical protein CYLTODRAFT_149456 [Cylindrobasidium torrendii FP15055 ss-10]
MALMAVISTSGREQERSGNTARVSMKNTARAWSPPLDLTLPTTTLHRHCPYRRGAGKGPLFFFCFLPTTLPTPGNILLLALLLLRAPVFPSLPLPSRSLPHFFFSYV